MPQLDNVKFEPYPLPHLLDSVKWSAIIDLMTASQPTKPRHHGNLKTALVEAGVALLAEGGHGALTLRKCAARAGVSHAAPAHHFNGLKGLMTAIVAQGFKLFTQTMIEHRDAADEDPHARLVAVCNGYLAFAQDNQAMAALMFRTDEIFTCEAEYQTISSASYQVLAEACAPFNAGPAGARGVEVLIWSLVEGYASLARAGTIDTVETPFAAILPRLNLQLR